MRKSIDVIDKRKVTNHQRSWIVLILGLTLGSCYSIWIRDEYAIYGTINALLRTEGAINHLTILKDSLVLYMIQFMGVVGCLLFSYTRGVAYLILLVISSGYGFTITSFLLLYGVRGIGISLLLLGMPSLVILGGILWLFIQRENLYKPTKQTVITIAIGISGLIFVVSVFNAYVQPYLEKIICNIG